MAKVVMPIKSLPRPPSEPAPSTKSLKTILTASRRRAGRPPSRKSSAAMLPDTSSTIWMAMPSRASRTSPPACGRAIARINASKARVRTTGRIHRVRMIQDGLIEVRTESELKRTAGRLRRRWAKNAVTGNRIRNTTHNQPNSGPGAKRSPSISIMPRAPSSAACPPRRRHPVQPVHESPR